MVMQSLLGLLWIGGGWFCLESFWCSISCTVLLDNEAMLIEC